MSKKLLVIAMLIVQPFCLSAASARDAEVCPAVKNGGPVEAAIFAAAKVLIEEKHIRWLPDDDPCAALAVGDARLLPGGTVWSVGFSDAGDCSANVFLNARDLSVKDYGIVGCY